MNIFSIITIVISAAITGYSIFLVHRHKNKLNTASGMAISTAIAVMTGLITGYLIAVINGDLFLASGIGMITGFMLGLLSGQPIGILAILSGSTTGIIGGLIGSLLGLFLSVESPFIMLGIMLGLFIIIIGLVIMYILVETNEKLSLDTRAISPFAILSAGVILVSLFLFLYGSDLIKMTSNEATASNDASKVAEVDVTKDAAPKIKMEVTQAGYTPNIIHVKKGVPVVLEINNPLDSSSCLSTFQIPAFNIKNVDLKTGVTTLNFTPTEVGEYTFSCGMEMYKGKIIVE